MTHAQHRSIMAHISSVGLVVLIAVAWFAGARYGAGALAVCWLFTARNLLDSLRRVELERHQ